jgi:hypothetical protein
VGWSEQVSRKLLIVVAVIVVVALVAVALAVVGVPGVQQAAGPDESQSFPQVATPPSGATAIAAAQAIPIGPHPTPQEETFHGCPAGGDGTDPPLNMLKNRIDPVTNPSPVNVKDLVALPWPSSVDFKHMASWPSAAATQVAQYNGDGLLTTGYFLRVTAEGAESTNCHSTAPDEIDYHVWIASRTTDTRLQAVVVEFTPRLRAVHSGWTLKAFQALAKQKAQVRITGWLMLDPEHPDQVGKTRGTIWELHPVTKIEVLQSGKWVDLDTMGG